MPEWCAWFWVIFGGILTVKFWIDVAKFLIGASKRD